MKQIFILSLLVSSMATASRAQTDYSALVNPFIGTGGHGHTYPGATVPHGMVQLSPDTRLTGWDGCSGYHYSDSFVYGFSHTHLSGTGVSDYGDILFMPGTGEPSPDNKLYGSKFSHSREKATAGYYSVHLDDKDVEVELTASERLGMHHYKFNRSNNYVIIDLQHRDEVISSSLKLEDSVTVSGMRQSRGWANNQYVFFVAKFSRPVTSFGFWKDDNLQKGIASLEGKNVKAYFRFNPAAGTELLVKVALSPVSIEGAKKNLEAEVSGWDFNQVKGTAKLKWNEELGKIDVKSDDTSKLRIFYTALYHTAIVPNINMDVDGRYRGRDNQIHQAEGFTYYSVFSLWDTYRATHPLYTILDVSRTIDYIKTFLVQYQQGGRLPVWELASCETDCMIGYHSVPVIWDAFAKGINEFDTVLALEAMKKSASWDHLGLPAYQQKHLIEVSDEPESVSKTLEYAYDDWCIAMYAKKIGRSSDFQQYIQRAQYYKNMLNLHTGFMQPRDNGGWLAGFDPREVNNNYTEANSWQYSFSFQQDIGGYMKLRGGPEALEKMLDGLFTAPDQTTGRDQSDITGMIGQYAHGNEPSHHIILMYDHAGNASKAQYYVHKVMTEFYKDAPDGLIGNEDCGQMSAWYIFNALGFYPVTPGDNRYFIGTPSFSMAEIKLPNDKSFIINAPHVSEKNFYIQDALLSTTSSLMPKKMMRSFLTHQEISGGGLVTFMMGDKPASVLNFPVPEPGILSDTKANALVLNPVIEGGPRSFRGKKKIIIQTPLKNESAFYSVSGTMPTHKSISYKVPFWIDSSISIRTKSFNTNGDSSAESVAEFVRVDNHWSVNYLSAYEPQYSAGGNGALIDGLTGTANWRKGNWQGFQGNDAVFILDLGKQQRVNAISIGFLQDTRAWIIMPKSLIVQASSDGKNFSTIYKGENFLPIKNLEPQIMRFDLPIDPTITRYIKFTALQYGQMPDWHEGAGGNSHIFIDEVKIN